MSDTKKLSLIAFSGDFDKTSGMYREWPDSKEDRIFLQWLKFRLVFHVT